MACLSGMGVAFAQAPSGIRPDAGVLSVPESTGAPAPSQVAPTVRLPVPPPPPAAQSSVRMTPSGFRFIGNRQFDAAVLGGLLADRLNRPTDLAGLTEAANQIAAFYRSRGYVLTEAYLPEQAFAQAGGIVTITVLEARIGRVSVQARSPEVPSAVASRVVGSQLLVGDAVSEYALDKTVLLLRDMAGYEADAVVEPGREPGLVDVIVNVSASGPRTEGSLSADNHGTRAAGATRATASASLNNITGRGDVLAISGQGADQRGSATYRVGYTLPVGGSGTKLTANVLRLTYALGKQFEALGATGRADIAGATLSQPFVRGRNVNLYGTVSAERKRLLDEVTTPSLTSSREIVAVKFGLAGNVRDALAGGQAVNSYSATATFGHLTLSPADEAADAGAGGLKTAGAFEKINLDYQRLQYFGGASTIAWLAQLQWANKNLPSAEKMVLGGPNGVRGYPVGEGVGDAGVLMNFEYRHELPVTVVREPLTLLAFYDVGQVRFNQNGPSVAGTANSVTLSGYGVGATVGQTGRFLLRAYLAWPGNSTPPTTGDPYRAPRAWVSAQTWF